MEIQRERGIQDSSRGTQQAPHGAAVSPISVERDSWEPQTAEIHPVEVEHMNMRLSLSLFGRESYGKEGQRIQLRSV